MFPDGSVTVTVCGAHVNPFCHTIAVQLTTPVESAGLGLHVIPGIVTVDHDHTLLTGTVTVVPVCAGFGVIAHTVGSVGRVVSIVTHGLSVVTVGPLPASSVQATTISYVH